jgi:putative endonuclease
VDRDARRRVGRLGERIAAERLAKLGYRVVERNYRTREGEIDLIACGRGALVFCEVKTLVARGRPARGPASPLEGVGPAKRAQVRRMARAWLAERAGLTPAGSRSVRFDAIGVVLSPAGALVALEHLEAAF